MMHNIVLFTIVALKSYFLGWSVTSTQARPGSSKTQLTEFRAYIFTKRTSEHTETEFLHLLHGQ